MSNTPPPQGAQFEGTEFSQLAEEAEQVSVGLGV